MKQHSKCLLVLLALGILFSCAQAPQQMVSEKPVAPTVDLTSKKIRDSIVLIESENASGTGFFIAPDLVATNTHVVAHAGPVSVKSPDKEKDWTIKGVVGFDAKNSLAVLKLTDEGIPLPLADSGTAQIGESISIPGYPDGEFEITEGSIQSIRKDNKWLRVNTTMSKERNGSPVLNNNGQVIAVIVSYNIGSYSYAMPSSALKILLDKSTPIEPLTEWQKREHIRAAAYYSLGEEKLDAEDYTGAIIDFDKVIELNPAYVRAYYERGRAQAYLGDYANAIASCTQVIEIDPDAPDAYFLRGSVKARLRADYAAAIIDLDKAIELDTQHVDAYSNRGGIKYGLGESESARGNAEKAQRLYESAIADCDKAIQIDPEDANTYNNRAAARLALGDLEEAILDFNRAIEIAPENADAYNNRGLVKLRRGESEAADGNAKEAQRLYKAAIKDITRSIQIDPEDADPYNNRGVAKFKLGESKNARANVKKAKKAKKAQHLYEAAIADYTQAIKINPKYADAYENRGRARSHLGESVSDRGEVEKARELYKAAVEDYTQVVKINPEDADTYNDLATAKCKLGDIESADGDAEKAQRLYHEGITDYDKSIQLNNPEDVAPKATDSELKKVGDSTVLVTGWIETSGNFFGGSGFFVGEDKIVTNLHVVAQPGPVFVKLRGKEKICAVEGVTAFDAENDLVVLKIAGQGIPLSVGDSEAIQDGEPVVVVGYPHKRYKVIKGTIQSTPNSGEWLRMNANIGSGGSGSPMLNSNSGQVVGIHAAGNEHYGYAIPSKVLKVLLAQSKPIEPLMEWQRREFIRAYALFVQGQIKYNANHYHEAIADFDKAIKINAQFFYAYYKRGDAKFALGNHEAAIADYDKAIKINDGIFNIYFDRGLAKSKLGDNEAAIVDYDKAIAIDPKHATAYHNRGLAKLRLRDFEGAILDFNKDIKINPDHTDAYKKRAHAKFKLGESKAAQGDIAGTLQLYQSAMEDCTKTIWLTPKDADAYDNRGWAYFHLGKAETDRRNMKKAADLYQKAIEDYTHAIKLNPEHRHAYRNRANAKFRLGDYEAAIPDLDKAIQMDSKNAKYYYDRGRAKEALGQTESAKADFQKAKELDRDIGK